jgi:enediyne biosynthesis protein E4
MDGRVDNVKYLEPMLLFHNTGNGLKNVSSESGPIFSQPLAARGMALGDFDNNGSVDVLFAINNGAPLLRNNAGTQNHWLGLSLIGKKSNPDAIGARISYQAGDLKQTRFKVGGGSYLSSHDPRVVLALGRHEKSRRPGNQMAPAQRNRPALHRSPINRYINIVEGEDKWK